METKKRDRREPQEELSREEIRSIISSIKRMAEEEFEEELKKMTPEERKAAIEFADAML